MSRVIRALERAGLVATRALAALGLLALLLLASMTLADGLARWLLNAPIEGVRDAGSLVIAVAITSLFPVGLAERGHISIRMAESVFGRSAANFLDAAAAVVVALVMCLMCWQFFVYAGKVAQANETTWILKWPRAPFWYAVSWILAVGAAVQIVIALADVQRVAGRVVNP